MPRRSVLTPAQLAALCALPTTEVEIARQYTLDERDLAVIRQRRGAHNRLGFAVQLCYLRYPGQALRPGSIPPEGLLTFVAQQVGAPPDCWAAYAQRDETRREHALELQAAFDYRAFTANEPTFRTPIRHF
jgi:TnpA family transposase